MELVFSLNARHEILWASVACHVSQLQLEDVLELHSFPAIIILFSFYIYSYDALIDIYRNESRI